MLGLNGRCEHNPGPSIGITGEKLDNSISHPGPLPLLAEDETPPFEIENPDGAAALVLVCDHARNTIPRSLCDLGLDSTVLGEHVALDIGCEMLARRLMYLLDGALILARYSRLVIDLNRHLADPASILSCSDRSIIPGNQNLSAEQRLCRAEEVFVPYHNAVASQVEHVRVIHGVPVLIALHSFTPELAGEPRPWEIGVLWTDDQRMSLPLLRSLRNDPNLCVGDNQPYDAREHVGYTIETHGGANGFPHVLIEVRQDLIKTEAGIMIWADRLAEHLMPILADDELYHRWDCD